MPGAGRAAHLLLLRLSVFTLLLQVLLSSLVGKPRPASAGLPLLYTMVGGWRGSPEIQAQWAGSQRSVLNLFTWHGRVPSNPAICACGVHWGIIITSRKANFLSCASFCGACSEVVASEGERTPQSTSQEQAFDLQMEGLFGNPKDWSQQESASGTSGVVTRIFQ